MGLIGNYSVISKSPGRFYSGTTVSADRYNFNKSGALKNRFVCENNLGLAKFSSIPHCYPHPYTWAMAQTAGGLAAYRLSESISVTDANLAAAWNLVADGLTATLSETNAALALIANLSADLTASGQLTDANLAIVILLEASFSASGSFTTADLGNILNLAASLAASGVLSDAAIVTLINLSADLSPNAGQVSDTSISTELLDNQDIETGFSLRESIRLMLAALVGKASGAETTTITFRDINDTVDRIVATVDSNGNRTSVTKDVT
jgi:hypothetical protein